MCNMKSLVFLALIEFSVSMETSEIYMKRSKLDDQESSASGYSYQIHSGQPAQFHTFHTNGVNVEKFGYPPVTVGKFDANDHEPVLLPILDVQPPYLSLVDSYGYPTHQEYTLPEHIGSLENIDDAAYKYGAQSSVPTNYGLNEGLDEEKSKFVKGNGQQFKGVHSSAHGEKGNKGYKSLDAYEKGAQGKHGNEGHKEHYNEKGGNKKGHYNEAANYGDHHESGKAHKGGSFKESKGHKKGSKTTGFHNVYHKDEYKKDHSFYDESDNSGSFNKYEDHEAKKGANEGGYKKGGHHDSGYKGGNFGTKGFASKGKFEDNVKGYKGANGEDSYYKDASEYAKKGDEENDEEYGYSESEKENLKKYY